MAAPADPGHDRERAAAWVKASSGLFAMSRAATAVISVGPEGLVRSPSSLFFVSRPRAGCLRRLHWRRRVFRAVRLLHYPIVREIQATGSLSLRAFYARRARRLPPAAAITLLVTLGASILFLPTLRIPNVAMDIAGAQRRLRCSLDCKRTTLPGKHTYRGAISDRSVENSSILLATILLMLSGSQAVTSRRSCLY